jgi:hypothetical protein
MGHTCTRHWTALGRRASERNIILYGRRFLEMSCRRRLPWNSPQGDCNEALARSLHDAFDQSEHALPPTAPTLQTKAGAYIKMFVSSTSPFSILRMHSHPLRGVTCPCYAGREAIQPLSSTRRLPQAICSIRAQEPVEPQWSGATSRPIAVGR